MKKVLSSLFERTLGFVYRLIYWGAICLPTVKLYQPVFGQDRSGKTTRGCADRWQAFSSRLPAERGSVLDIGCNIGYFSFKCAERGDYTYGVESHRSNILLCNTIRHIADVDNCAFVRQLIDIEFIKRMPSFDVVINLSVFHHWVKRYGLEQAGEMMRLLALKCSCLVFETGQSTETGSQWPEVLSFMGENPEEWIDAFLRDLGFSEVENIGSFPTGLTSTDRYLFVAKK